MQFAADFSLLRSSAPMLDSAAPALSLLSKCILHLFCFPGRAATECGIWLLLDSAPSVLDLFPIDLIVASVRGRSLLTFPAFPGCCCMKFDDHEGELHAYP